MKLTKDAALQIIHGTAALHTEMLTERVDLLKELRLAGEEPDSKLSDEVENLLAVGASVDEFTVGRQIPHLSDESLVDYALYCMQIWVRLNEGDIEGAYFICE